MTAALIIAAGKTSHKDAFDPLQEVGSITAAQRVIKVFQRVGIARIVLVLNADMKRLERQAAQLQVVCLHGQEGAEMFHSIQLGLAYLQGKCEKVLITPVDVPLFTADTIRALQCADGTVRVPLHDGRAGHPLLLAASQFPPVLAYSGQGGLAGAIRALGLTRTEVPVEDAGVLHNVQQNPAFSSLLEQHTLQEIHPELQLRLAREKAFFGPESHQLLQLTQETRSLREACARMGISYSKGWSMVSLMEAQLGTPVIARQQGGKSGGHSSLTPLGTNLLAQYGAFASEAQAAIQALFQKHFGEY